MYVNFFYILKKKFYKKFLKIQVFLKKSLSRLKKMYFLQICLINGDFIKYYQL